MFFLCDFNKLVVYDWLIACSHCLSTLQKNISGTSFHLGLGRVIGERTGIHKGWCEDGDGITDIKGAYVAFARLDKEQKNSDLFEGGHKLYVSNSF